MTNQELILKIRDLRELFNVPFSDLADVCGVSRCYCCQLIQDPREKFGRLPTQHYQKMYDYLLGLYLKAVAYEL